MDFPIKFPNEADVIAEEAARFRSLSAEEQLDWIKDLVNTGEFLMRVSNKAAFVREYDLEQRGEMRRLIREFVSRHA